MEWAHGGASLSLPPKRNLHTIGVPEPIRQHFQQLDTEALRRMDPEDEEAKGTDLTIIIGHQCFYRQYGMSVFIGNCSTETSIKPTIVLRK